MAQTDSFQEQTKEQTTTIIQNRVAELMANYNFKEVAEHTGIDQSTIRRIASGDRGASAVTIALLAKELHTTSSYLLNETNCQEIYFIKYDKRACGGDRKDYPISREMISTYIEQYKDTLRYCVYEGGDAMSPRYRNNDILLYAKWKQLLNRERTIQNPVINGDITVIKYRGRVLVRGYFEEPKGIVLKAFNPNFQDISVLDDDDFEIIGKVVCKISAPQSETGFF